MSSQVSSTDTIMVRVTPEDPARWRRTFENDRPIRARNGVAGEVLYEDVDVPGSYVIYFDIEDLERFRSLMGSDVHADSTEASGPASREMFSARRM